jgi:glycosyltransferase involved in cell wall biosynthesis
MRVSVAMCTYNGAKFVGEQLESVISQTRLPDEIIICDDGSSDETRRILEEFEVNSPVKVRLFLNDNNLGVAKNFAKAIELSSGDVIFLADQDDVWAPSKVAKIVGVFLATDAAMVFSNGSVIDELGKDLGYSLWEAFGFSARRRRKWAQGAAVEILLRYNVVTGATMALRSEVKEWVLPIPQSWIHDGWIALVASVFFETGFVDEALIAYRQHGANQVGAERLRASGRLARAIRNRRVRISVETNAWHEVKRRFGERGIECRRAAMIDEKIKHLERRQSMLGLQRLLRIPGVAKELSRGRYHRYAHGLYTAILDLVASNRG